jgi:hypothetical protein
LREVDTRAGVYAAWSLRQESASLPQSAPTAADLQQKTKAMQALMEKLENTRNAAERERLLARHHQAMREQLESLKHMNCAMGMTGGDAQGGEENRTMGQGMMAGGMMKCHEITQMRLDAMVGMMEQMMRHEAAQHRGRL